MRLRCWIGAKRRAEIDARVAELLELGGLAARRESLVGELSHGDQRATEIMMALALGPRLLMLDEPTAGMGDQETYDIARLIRRLHRERGLSILLIEHDMRVVFNLADRIMVLAEGKVLAEGGPARSPPAKPCRPPISGKPPHERAARRGPAQLLRQEPHPARRRRSRCARARSWRCSAATAPARPRRCAA